jgi:hypothetical protein
VRIALPGSQRGTRDQGDNKEAARDLVSFAIDGGTLIYGIDEDKINRASDSDR